MRVIIGTVAKGSLGRVLGGRIRGRIVDALRTATPWLAAATTEHAWWADDVGLVRMDVVTNEPSEARLRPLLRRTTDHATAWTGYLQGHVPDPTGEPEGDLRGCFALVQGCRGRLRAQANIHRLEPVYLAEGRIVTVVSTSARVAHAVARTGGGDDTDALLGLAGPGYMISDATPYPGVRALPADVSVSVTPSGATVRPLPEPDLAAATLRERSTSIAERLLRVAEDIAEEEPALECHITGGKDSRLVLAAFAEVGAELTAVSRGFATHPDVRIGADIARRLGFSHRIDEPVRRTGPETDHIVVDARERAWRALRLTEGMITAYEGFAPPSVHYRSDTIVAGGHGGELLRGGYGYRLRRLDSTQAVRRLDLVAAPHQGLLTEVGRARLQRLLDPWRERVAGHPASGLEQFYRLFRAGRWHAVARAAYSASKPQRTVLADNAVVRLAARGPQEEAWDERLFHGVLRSIDARLCQLPFYKSRWNFERDGPVDHFSPERWQDREPVPTPEGPSGFNWRIHYPVSFHNRLGDSILSAGPRFFEHFDRPAVERFLRGVAISRSGGQAKLVWAMYTAAQLLDGVHELDAPPPAETTLIEFPSRPC